MISHMKIEPFIRSDQYQFIKFQVKNITDLFCKCSSSSLTKIGMISNEL